MGLRRYNSIVEINNEENYAILKNDSQNICFKISLHNLEKVLNQCSWFISTKGYIIGNVMRGKVISLHLFLKGKKHGYVVDHLNRDKTDCRDENLEYKTMRENLLNSKKFDVIDYIGVKKDHKKFIARCWVNGEYIKLGLVDSPEEAAKIYDEAIVKIHGKNASTNKSLGKYKEVV